MSCEAEVERALRQSGLRVTVQRSRILTALRHAEGHQSAAEVFARVSAEAPHAGISLSTVYRTLEGLRDAGIVAGLDVGPGAAAYEWASAEAAHHHLVCRICGSRTEIDLPQLARLEREIRARTGFEPAMSHLGISGVCRDCGLASERAGHAGER